jgi:hypothetical protein
MDLILVKAGDVDIVCLDAHPLLYVRTTRKDACFCNRVKCAGIGLYRKISPIPANR